MIWRFFDLRISWFWPLLVPLIASAPSAATEITTNASVELEVIQCAEGHAEAPTLSIAAASEYPKLRYVAVDSASAQRLADGYYKVTDSLPEGNYFFQLQSSHCSDYLQAAVLSGHKRILSIALYARNPENGIMRAQLFPSENSVFGTLAVRPFVGWIVAANGATRALDLQDNAYYIERVEPGKYRLRFELHGGLQSEMPLDLSNISRRGLSRYDVDAPTFRKNIGSIVAHGGTLKDCYYCY